MRDLFYTVLCDRAGYPVRYINRQTCHTGYFTGPFRDPGATSQEFQACVGGTTWDCHYLAEQQWQASACALIQQHRQALAAWHRWLALSGSQQTPRRRKED